MRMLCNSPLPAKQRVNLRVKISIISIGESRATGASSRAAQSLSYFFLIQKYYLLRFTDVSSQPNYGGFPPGKSESPSINLRSLPRLAAFINLIDPQSVLGVLCPKINRFLARIRVLEGSLMPFYHPEFPYEHVLASITGRNDGHCNHGVLLADRMPPLQLGFNVSHPEILYLRIIVSLCGLTSAALQLTASPRRFSTS